MILQYPNTGKVYLPGASTKGSDGNWSESSLELQLESKCRVEPNKGNQYVIGQDGKQITFSSIVYMPLPTIVSSIIDPVVTSATNIIYAGETVLYIVPAEMDGETEVVLSTLLGQKFTLVVDGRALVKDTEFEILASGFKMLTMPLIEGQRFEITKYYLFRTGISGGSGVVSSSGFEIKPGTLFEVWEGERLIVKEPVKQFSKGQLNMRVWL